MSARKFKFISPGVFLNEIDNTQLPNEPADVGPLFIGRAKYGPAMRPVTVDSFAEFVQLYGEPIPGGKSDDVWRNGNEQTPTYGAYAAQAWLRNSSTCTYVRLLGSENLNATDAGKAGWKIDGDSPLGKDIEAIPTFPGDATGSAYGLFVFGNNLSGTNTTSAHGTGSLVATWYVEDGIIGLVGTETGGTSILSSQAGSGSCRLVSTDTNGVFTVSITGSSDNSYKNRVISFSLNENNKNYIRNVFNTNPAAVNTTVTKGAQRERYWLGETYAREFLQKVERKVVTGSGGPMIGSTGATYIGLMLPLATGSAARHSNRQIPFEDGATRYNPATGLVFGQDLGGAAAAPTYAYGDMTPLFKFHALDHAEWAQNNLKISITNINYSQDQFNKFGTFDVLVRRANDTDAAPIVVERFSNCNLDANSLDYIARKIGDSYVQFDSTTRRLVTRGEHLNNSKYIRVEMEAENYNPELLPFGYYGPLKYKDFEITKVTNESQDNFGTGVMGLGAKNVLASNYVQDEGNSANCLILTGSGLGGSGATGPELKILYPSHELRISGNQEGLADQKDAYWGVWTGITKNSGKFNRDFADLNRNRTDTITDQLADTAYSEYQYIFTLDEICSGSTTGLLTWVSGSRKAAVSGDRAISAQTDFTYKNVIDKGVDRFTMPLYGGSDGLDVTERDPFRNTLLNGKTETTNYAYNSVKESIDIVRDPEFVPYNLVSVPGITNEQLTTHLINTAEARADALAVIDLKGDFQPAHEGTSKTYPDLNDTITNLKDRQINSSYGCAYYPFVQIRDTLEGQLVYMPSSVVAIGAMSYTDRVRAPWFAPAGFNRGGLSSGIAGLPVVNVTQKLTAQDRDLLYDANINPIASFPNEGIVIFGQKTLQVTRSALDRINVRRLLIFIKKGISNIAAGVLFEPNVRATWARFIGQAEPFLADVQARFGLDDYKLVLDETTTTPDLIDRNILYAKVYLKPTRAIEFVAVDFILTNTGAAFED